MSKSTGIVLTATGISFANEWAQDNTPNFRIVAAGMGVALLFNGVERLNERAGVGLSVIMLITVMLTPINGKSPSDTLIDMFGGQGLSGNKPDTATGRLVPTPSRNSATRGGARAI